MSGLKHLLVATGLLWAGPGMAAEYRKIRLADGRSFIAEVGETKGMEMSVILPQGPSTVALTQVFGIEPAGEDLYLDQAPWTLVLLPVQQTDASLAPVADSARDLLLEHASALSAVETHDLKGIIRTSGAPALKELAACAADPLCIQPLADQAGLTVVIAAEVSAGADGPLLTLHSVWGDAPKARRKVELKPRGSLAAASATVRMGLLESLYLESPAPAQATAPIVAATPSTPATPEPAPTPKEAPPEVAKAPKGEPSPAALRRMSWAPVPGLPSLARRDLGGFALSWGVVVPGSLLAVGAAGQGSTSKAQFAAVGILSYYGLTVGVNRAVGLKGLEDVAVVAAPIDGGGTLQLTARTR